MILQYEFWNIQSESATGFSKPQYTEMNPPRGILLYGVNVNCEGIQLGEEGEGVRAFDYGDGVWLRDELNDVLELLEVERVSQSEGDVDVGLVVLLLTGCVGVQLVVHTSCDLVRHILEVIRCH